MTYGYSSDSDWAAESIPDSEFSLSDSAPKIAAAQLNPQSVKPKSAKKDLKRTMAQAQLEPISKQALLGHVIANNYSIMEFVGEGELCFVYNTMSLNDDTLLAAKTLKNPQPALIERFKDASMKIGPLTHENIVKSESYIESRDGRPFYLMEYLEGVSLGQVLQTVNFVQSEEDIFTTLIQVSKALEHAHQLGTMHGRLTPRDIFMSETDESVEIKVTDFAISDLRQVSPLTKDGPYLSPERLSGAPASVLSDVFSLGVVAYKLITGRFPFSKQMVTKGEFNVEPTAISVHRPDLNSAPLLDRLLFEMLEAKPEWRIDSMRTFQEGLAEWIEEVHKSRPASRPVSSQAVLDADVEQSFAPLDSDGQVETASGDATADGAISSSESNPALASSIHKMKTFKRTPNGDSRAKASAPAKQEDETPAQSGKRKLRRTGQTFHNLVALKQNLFEQEHTLVVQFTAVAAQGKSRRSPVATAARLAAITGVSVLVLVIGSFYVATHGDELTIAFEEASLWLSSVFSRERNDAGIANDTMERSRSHSRKSRKGTGSTIVKSNETNPIQTIAAPVIQLRFNYAEHPEYKKWVVNNERCSEVRRMEKK